MNAQVKTLGQSSTLTQSIAQCFPKASEQESQIIAQIFQKFEDQMNHFEIMTTNRRGHVQTGDAILFGVARISKNLADEVSAPLKDLLTVWVKDRWRNQEVHQNRIHQLFKVLCASKVDSNAELDEVMETIMDFFILPQKDLLAQLSESTLNVFSTSFNNLLTSMDYLPTNHDAVWQSPFRFGIYMNLANVIIGFGTDSLIVKRYFDEFHGAIETLEDLYDYHEFYKEFNYRNTLNESEKARLMVNFLNNTAKTKLLMSMNHNRIGFMPLFRNFRDPILWDDSQWLLQEGQAIKNYSSQVFLTQEDFQSALKHPKKFVDFFCDPEQEQIEANHHSNVILLNMYLRDEKRLTLIKSLQCVLLKDLTNQVLAEFSYYNESDLKQIDNLMTALHSAHADIQTQKKVLSKLIHHLKSNKDIHALLSESANLIDNIIES